MALKLQDCSNDDLGLSLIFFYGKVKYGKMLEHKISLKVCRIWPENGDLRLFNENMKICKDKWSGLNSYMLTYLNTSSKAIGPVETKFHVEPLGMEKTKTCSNHPGLMTNRHPCPYMIKPLKIFFSRSNWPLSLELGV